MSGRVAGPAGAVLLLALGATGGSAQAPGLLVASAVEPDSVFVGRGFRLGLTVSLPSAGEVRFPPVLALPDELEQRGPVEVRSAGEGIDWRAYYTIVPWKAERTRLPPVEAVVEASDGSRTPVTLVPPQVEVLSVLPPGVPDLELREARGFLRVRAFPWWMFLALLPLAVLAWWWRRRGQPAIEAGTVLGPAGMALRDLERLRAEWRHGDVSADRFYDRFETVLRRYLTRTRDWSPGRALIGLTETSGELVGALRRSLIVRFARVQSPADAPDAALDAAEQFVRSELPAVEPEGTDPAGPAPTPEEGS